MTSPDEVFAEHMEREVADVASLSRMDDFVITGLDPTLPLTTSANTVNLTAVYMTPGIPEPRLRRLDFPNPDLSPDERDALMKAYMKDQGRGVMALPEDVVSAIADFTASACEEIDETEAESDVSPVRMLGMLGVYTADGETPFSLKFTSKPFAEILRSHLPGAISPEPSELTEEALLDIRSSIAEHEDKPPFDQWKPDFERERHKIAAQVGGMRVAAAISTMHLLLLPREVSHPTIESRLF